MMNSDVNDINRYLIQPGVLQIATLDNFVPMIFQDEHNNWQGYEVDILTAIANQLHLKLAFAVYPYEGIWTLPKQKKADIAAAGISITEQRIRDGAAFTEPYLAIKQSLLVKKEQEAEINSLEDTANKKVGIVPGTTGAAYASKHAPEGADLKKFNNEQEMLQALERDRIDAIARGEPGNRFQVKQHPEYTLTGIAGQAERFAFAIADTNQPLLNILNYHIQQLQKSDTLQQFYKRWFGTKSSR